MSDLDVWMAQVVTAFDLDARAVEEITGPMLDRVRDVAHDVVRPGAPMSAFLVGLAAGAATGQGATTQELVDGIQERLAVLDRLIAQWQPPATQA
ncbi:DUF6457 domain-containing protein [Actinotalea sp.]|uniref:DUF6457 domain-containing protein n=1 Tax=Actinotalea sp. TaxID=1872145 RepID=UPI0035649E64